MKRDEKRKLKADIAHHNSEAHRLNHERASNRLQTTVRWHKAQAAALYKKFRKDK